MGAANQFTDTSGLMEHEIVRFFNQSRLQHLVILALFEGDNLPAHCTHMPLNPEPAVDVAVRDNFMESYLGTLKISPGIHDGAVMIQTDHDPPLVRGWSYRLYPPPFECEREANRGSGYNSSLDFSVVDGVTQVYLLYASGILRFAKGKVTKLHVR